MKAAAFGSNFVQNLVYSGPEGEHIYEGTVGYQNYSQHVRYELPSHSSSTIIVADHLPAFIQPLRHRPYCSLEFWNINDRASTAILNANSALEMAQLQLKVWFGLPLELQFCTCFYQNLCVPYFFGFFRICFSEFLIFVLGSDLFFGFRDPNGIKEIARGPISGWAKMGFSSKFWRLSLALLNDCPYFSHCFLSILYFYLITNSILASFKIASFTA
ncbi:unnamed protein product [Meloidogyne enterolobii]|uniref:Uncharacterized protein n=1 Tax=Meloidogyne enterolobii TaxID=390850 RepID=A0ACB0Y016_MELEN